MWVTAQKDLDGIWEHNDMLGERNAELEAGKGLMHRVAERMKSRGWFDKRQQTFRLCSVSIGL